jgi:hypothetical protein
MECSQQCGSAGNSACAPLECRFCRRSWSFIKDPSVLRESGLSREPSTTDNEEHSCRQQNLTLPVVRSKDRPGLCS